MADQNFVVKNTLIANGVFTANSLLTQANNLNVSLATNTATLNTTGLANIAALNVVGAVNTATLYTTGLVNAASLNVAGAVNTATFNSTGLVNAASLNVVGLTNTASINVVGAVNTATLNTTGLANTANLNVVGAVNTATLNTTGLVSAASLNVAGAVNTATFNSTGLVNAASLNVTGIANVQSGNFYANNLILQGDGTNAYIRPTNSGSVLTLGSNNTNQITLAANGNLGIGTATPANKLDVNGDMHVSSVFATYLNGSITSSQVTTALGYTPYNSTNPSGYISAISGSGNVAYDSSRLGGTAAASYALLASPTFTGTVTTGNVITVGTAAYHVSNGNFGVGTSSPLSKIAVQPSANNTDALTVGSSNYTNYFTIKTESSANAATLGYWCGSSAFGNVNISANYVNLPTNVTINGLQAATQSYVTGYAPSLTGSGASGTWGINVTGSAASITGTYGGSITSSQITTGLGYTPYNSTNPSGYITSSSLSSYAPLSGATFTGSINSGLSVAAANTNSSAIVTGASFVVGGSGGNYLAFGQSTGTYAQWIQSGYNGGTARYSINLNPAGGNVGINTGINSDAAYNLDVNGKIRATYSIGVGSAAPSTTTGQILASDNIIAYYSDARLKENITPIPDALAKVNTLSGVTYNSNDLAESYGYTDRSQQVGVIAQEVKAVLPQVIKPAPFDTDSEGNSKSGENYMTVQYEKLVPLLIEAIKELTAKVNDLESKLGGN